MSLKRIDELFNFEKGVLQSSKSTPGSYDFITASSEWKTHKEYTHDCEALIFAAAASGSLGRTHYVNGKFISSDLCFIITPKDPKNFPVDLKFYHLLFNSLRNEIVRNTKAGTSKEAIGLTSFGKYQIPYFSIENQKATKTKFIRIQQTNLNVSEEFNLQQDLLTQLRQSFLREAMQGKLVKQDPKDGNAKYLLEKIKAEKAKSGKKEKELPPIKPEEIPFEIPENWVWCRLGEIADNIEYGTSEKADLNSSNIPVLRMNNIQDGKLDYENLKYVSPTIDDLPKLYLKKNDLLFNRTNSWELVGKAGVYHGTDDTMTFASYLIRVQFQDGIFADFINAYINSSLCRTTQLEPEIIQQNGQANFNGTKLRNIICPLPPSSEQSRIIKRFDELMNLCDDLQESVQVSREQNELLLQQVLKEALTT